MVHTVHSCKTTHKSLWVKNYTAYVIIYKLNDHIQWGLTTPSSLLKAFVSWVTKNMVFDHWTAKDFLCYCQNVVIQIIWSLLPHDIRSRLSFLAAFLSYIKLWLVSVYFQYSLICKWSHQSPPPQSIYNDVRLRKWPSFWHLRRRNHQIFGVLKKNGCQQWAKTSGPHCAVITSLI